MKDKEEPSTKAPIEITGPVYGPVGHDSTGSIGSIDSSTTNTTINFSPQIYLQNLADVISKDPKIPDKQKESIVGQLKTVGEQRVGAGHRHVRDRRGLNETGWTLA